MQIYIFTDASVHLHHAVGTFLIKYNLDNFNDNVLQSVHFDTNSSTFAEFSIIMHVLLLVGNMINIEDLVINLYTDCMNFLTLVKNKNCIHKYKSNKNYLLYLQLTNIVSKLNINIIWTPGHPRIIHHNYQKYFAIVDKHAKKTLFLHLLHINQITKKNIKKKKKKQN